LRIYAYKTIPLYIHLNNIYKQNYLYILLDNMTTTNYSNDQLLDAATRECKLCKNNYLLSKDNWHMKRGYFNLRCCKNCINARNTELTKTKEYKPMTEDQLLYYRNYYAKHKVKIDCFTCNIKLFKHNVKKHIETVSHKNKLETTGSVSAV
jgi:hypothetical protein